MTEVPPTPTPSLYCSDGSGETRLEESKITHRVTNKKTIAIVKGPGDRGGGIGWKIRFYRTWLLIGEIKKSRNLENWVDSSEYCLDLDLGDVRFSLQSVGDAHEIFSDQVLLPQPQERVSWARLRALGGTGILKKNWPAIDCSRSV